MLLNFRHEAQFTVADTVVSGQGDAANAAWPLLKVGVDASAADKQREAVAPQRVLP